MQKCNFSVRLFSLFKISTRYCNTTLVTVSTTVAIHIMTPKHSLRYICMELQAWITVRKRKISIFIIAGV